jgi:hypothetical protein
VDGKIMRIDEKKLEDCGNEEKEEERTRTKE